MKILFFLFTILVSTVSFAENEQEKEQAIAWLEVVDSGNYAESWDQAAAFFQEQLSSAKWQQALNQVRAPLGNVLAREIKNSSSHSSLPGAPDGEYVVITLATSFENKKSAIETITVNKVGSDWRTVGYFIN